MTSYPTNCREWLAKLVSFNTISCNSNLELIHYVRDYLQSVGIASTLVHNEDKTKAHLFATLPGEGGATTGGIILSGHVDVVPVAGQKWTSDPFTMVERDGKLYGRGTADMKGYVAVVLALTPTFLAMKRQKPVHYAFSYDEEVGCTGIPVLVDYLKRKGFTADYCHVGEGSMQLLTGNKGHRLFRVTVKGKAIHSSMALMSTSCNAIEYAAMIIAKVRQLATQIRDSEEKDPSYPCPFSSMSTNLITGGNAVNTVPAECVFEFSIRIVKTSTADMVEKTVRDYVAAEILPAMRKEYSDAAVTIDAYNACPPFNTTEAEPLTKLARKMLKSSKVTKLGGTTEAGFFQEVLGIPTIILGPGGGGAHEADEYTTMEGLRACTKFVEELVGYCTKTAAPLTSHL